MINKNIDFKVFLKWFLIAFIALFIFLFVKNVREQLYEKAVHNCVVLTDFDEDYCRYLAR